MVSVNPQTLERLISVLVELQQQLQTPARESDWMPNQFQVGIMRALDGHAMTADELGNSVGDRRRLFRPGGIKELRERGLVAHSKSWGYYRPDAPPESLKPFMTDKNQETRQ